VRYMYAIIIIVIIIIIIIVIIVMCICILKLENDFIIITIVFLDILIPSFPTPEGLKNYTENNSHCGTTEPCSH